MKWFERIKNVKLLLIIVAILIAIASLLTSKYLIDDLKKEELNKMEVWAEAMRSLNQADENTDINLVLKVLNGNNTIPVVVLDKDGDVQTSRNLGKAFKADEDSIPEIKQMAKGMKQAGQTIRIDLDDANDYIEICYDESLMLKRLASTRRTLPSTAGTGLAKAIEAIAQVRVEGQPKLFLLDPRPCLAVIGDERLRSRLIELQEPVDLTADLAAVSLACALQVADRFLRLHGDTAFVYDAVILLFTFDENVVAAVRHAVAAQTQLFLINRPLNRRADQVEVFGIIVDVADRILRVRVRRHIERHPLPHRPVLRRRQQVFLFVTLEATLHFTHFVRLLCMRFGLLSVCMIAYAPEGNLRGTVAKNTKYLRKPSYGLRQFPR